jgi:hypothetical protein
MHGRTTSLWRTFETWALLVLVALACTLRVSATAAQQSSASGTTAPTSATAPAATTAPPATTRSSAAPAPAPSAPREMPTPEQLEPGVNTSSAATEAPTPVKTGGERAGKESAKPATAGAAAHKGPDRLQLDATEITGNRELPKVLYIVPWKRSDLGDLTGRPVNSLLDEVLQPLDRDVFQRENRYYNGLKPPAAASKAEAPGVPGTKP